MKCLGHKMKIMIPFLTALLAIIVFAPIAGAQDADIKASINLILDPSPPNKINNGGTGVETFNWTIPYDSTPDHYIFQVWDSTDTPITTHNNTAHFPPAEIVVSHGTVFTFPNRIEVNVDGLPTGPGTVTGSCKWHIPKGYPTAGFFKGHLEYYSKETQGTYEAQVTQTFLVVQEIGTLEIVKYNDLNKNGARDAGEPGLKGWHFTAIGPEILAGDTDINGVLTFSPIMAGTYQVTETLKTDWVCSDPGANLQKITTVPPGGTGHVDFGNYFAVTQAPPVFLRKWGSIGTEDGQFNQLRDVAVDASGNVYVAELGNNRIQKFTSSGAFITKWGTSGAGDSQFNQLSGVAVDASGNVYAADFLNNRIQKFTSAGAFITKWGTYGSGDGQFYYPQGVAVDASGNIYIAELGNNRIQKFTSSGAFITKWGTYGSGDGQFYPHGVVIDASGNVYVADENNNRIQKFTSSGAFITKWGTYGSGDGQFYSPRGVAADTSGNVYVADYGNFRIQKFTSSGDFITKWGTPGAADGQFNQPFGVTLDASGNVYIADSGNHRIQVFGNTPPPKLTSLGPNTGRQGLIIGVSINGTNLTGAIAVSFSGTGVTASNLRVNDTGTHILADVTITRTAAVGARDVTVTTPAGTSAALVGGFTVTAAIGTTVSIGSATVCPGQTVIVAITIETDQHQFGSATIRLQYNQAIVKINNVSAGDLGNVEANVDNANGRTTMAAAYGSTPGKTGTIKFTDLTLEAVGAPGSSSPLTITVIDMYNSDVNPITPETVNNGNFSIISPKPLLIITANPVSGGTVTLSPLQPQEGYEPGTES